MAQTLTQGQWVTHNDYPGAYGRIMPDTNPETIGMVYHGYPFLALDNKNLHKGQNEADEYTSEAHVLWESTPSVTTPRRSWEFITSLKPVDTDKYRIDVQATITVEIESPAEAKARDDVIQILTGALEDAGMHIYIRQTHVMNLTNNAEKNAA